MQVEFISNNVDVMTHDFLSSVALALLPLEQPKSNPDFSRPNAINVDSTMLRDPRHTFRKAFCLVGH